MNSAEISACCNEAVAMKWIHKKSNEHSAHCFTYFINIYCRPEGLDQMMPLRKADALLRFYGPVLPAGHEGLL